MAANRSVSCDTWPHLPHNRPSNIWMLLNHAVLIGPSIFCKHVKSALTLLSSCIIYEFLPFGVSLYFHLPCGVSNEKRRLMIRWLQYYPRCTPVSKTAVFGTAHTRIPHWLSFASVSCLSFNFQPFYMRLKILQLLTYLTFSLHGSRIFYVQSS